MSKMRSSLKNMLSSLFFITLVVALLLAVTYGFTKGTIEQSKGAKVVQSLAKVLPEFDNDPMSDTTSMVVDNIGITLYRATKKGITVGYAVSALSKSGFSGEIKLMVGFKIDGEIVNIEVVEQNETPGLGSKMADRGNVLEVSLVGKNPESMVMKVNKDGGDVDCITASTISSRAYVEAVDRAYRAFQVVAMGADLDSGPTIEELLSEVLPEFDNNPMDQIRELEYKGTKLKAYVGTKEGEITGYAVEGVTDRGYHGAIRLLVGFHPNTDIFNIVVTEHSETPGFGDAIEQKDNVVLLNFQGNSVDDLKMLIKQDGGDIDCITASTITTYAYIDCVEMAHRALKQLIKSEQDE